MPEVALSGQPEKFDMARLLGNLVRQEDLAHSDKDVTA
jgi:hypothetical protein